MTPATTATPDAPSAAGTEDKPATLLENVHATATEILGIFQRSPEWVVIILAWLAACFLPAFWYIGEDHWWSQIDSPLFLQPFVPLAVGALLWHEREALSSALRQTSRNKRHGAPWVVWIGCLIVLAASFVHVLTFAALGLLIVAVGIAYLAYGVRVTLQAARALAVGLLFIPPPSTFIAGASNAFGGGILKTVIILLQKLGKQCSITIAGAVSSIDISGHSIQVPHTQFAGVLFTIFALIVISVWRREKIGMALVTIATGALIVSLLAFFVPFFALLLPITPLTDSVVRVAPLLLAALSITAVVLAKRSLRSWQAGLASSSRALGKLSQQAQKATDRATAGVAASVGGGTRRVGGGITKGSENAIDNFIKFVTKPFKRKRKNRW